MRVPPKPKRGKRSPFYWWRRWKSHQYLPVRKGLLARIQNGDFVTNDKTNDFRKWLISGNQKRIFPDLATFYGYGGLDTQLKVLTDIQLNSIPDGEPVE